MQCKDIPDRPILKFLHMRELRGLTWCCWYEGFENSIGQAMPPDTPPKLRIAKMAKLIKRGLVSGCGCGCRGDYEITPKGISYYMWDELEEMCKECVYQPPTIYASAEAIAKFREELQEEMNRISGVPTKYLGT